MHDFPVTDCAYNKPEEAFEVIQSRFISLESAYSHMPILKDAKDFNVFFSRAVKLLHEILFTGILSNAGGYRALSDKKGGYVGFGGDDIRRPGNQKIDGAAPNQIYEKVEEALSYLKKGKKKSALANAVRFYQRFVLVHPFYDGNGRIGRAIVSIYLSYFGFYVHWEEILKKKALLYEKLNKCHVRQNGDQESYEKYLVMLTEFFEKYVQPLKELQ